MKFKNYLTDFAYWAGWNILSLLPEFIVRFLFDAAAKYVWQKKIKGIRQLELNLSRATGLAIDSPQIRELSLVNLKNYLRYYREVFLLPRWSITKINKKVIVRNVAQVDAALKKGGIVIALPHMGNWDLAGAWAANYFGQLCTVAERLRPEGVYQKFLKVRRKLGLTLISLEGDGNPYEFLKSNLLKGAPVALLADRDVSGTGMSNTFFGVPTKTPIGPALLAVESDLPLFTCATWYEGDKLIIEFDSQVELPFEENFSTQVPSTRASVKKAQEMSAIILQRFEKYIAAQPQSWHQLQPIWSDLKADMS